MAAFFTVADKLMMVFLLIVVGYTARRLNIIDDNFVDKLSGFLVKIVVPLFLMHSLQLEYEPELLKRGLTVFACCIFMHIIGLIVGLITSKPLKIERDGMSSWIFGCMFPNIGFMGIPVIALVLGGDSVFYCAFASFAFNLLAYTLGVYIIIRYSGTSGAKLPLKRILLAPANIGTVIGLIFFVLEIKIPSSILGTMDMVGGMITPLAMIYIGAVLVRSGLKKAFSNKMSYAIAFFRLIFMPLAGYIILSPFIHDNIALGVVILGLSTPLGAFCAILAGEYGGNTELVSEYTVVTTVLSLLTMPFFALLFT